MFVQVIEGKVSDSSGLRRQLDRWQAELRPGAAGFLGSTGGVTDDGVGFAIARFESASAAQAVTTCDCTAHLVRERPSAKRSGAVTLGAIWSVGVLRRRMVGLGWE